MSLLDKFVEAFSAKELRPRVRGVIVFGMLVVAATIVAGAYFMNWTYTIAIEGTAVWSAEEPGLLMATISEDDLGRIQPDRGLAVEIIRPNEPALRSAAGIVDIDPAAKTLRLEAPDFPPAAHMPGRFSVRLILVEEPYWKLLWGQRQE